MSRYSFHYTIRGDIENIQMSLSVVPRAYRLCRKYLTNPDTYYIVINDHIGDFVIAMGYMGSYKKRHNILHLTVCTSKKFSNLFRLYGDGYDDVLLLDSDIISDMIRLDQTKKGKWYLQALKNVDIMAPGNEFTSNVFEYPARYPEVTFHDCIKYGEMRLNQDDEFIPPMINDDLCGENDHKKRVVVLRGSRTVQDIEKEFYDELVTAIKSDGFDVVDTDSFERMDLYDTLRVCDKNTVVVGARSGIMDLLAYTYTNIITLYKTKNWEQHFFDLGIMPKTKSNIVQLISKMGKSEIIKNIEYILNEYGGIHD